MKKVLSLAVATSALLLLSACRTGNVGMYDRNNGTPNGTTNFGRTSGTNITDTARGNFKDGDYTNFGNSHDNVKERAIISIRNGRIVDIDLSTISQQGAANSGTRTSYGTGFDTSANYDTNNLTGTNTGTRYGTGNATDTNTGYTSGAGNSTANSYAANPGFGTDTGYGLGSGYDTGYGTNSEYRVGTGLNNTTNTGTTGITGTRTAAPINTNVNDTLNTTKTNLINAMLQAQSDNVTLSNTDKNMTTVVENWKLAVSRALNQARR